MEDKDTSLNPSALQPEETAGETTATETTTAPSEVTEETAEEAAYPPADQGKMARYTAFLKERQNLPLGLLAGFGAALGGAILWAVITVATEYQIGYMAVAVGFAVGYAVRYAGKGIDVPFGVAGAALSLFGCLLGNFLSVIGFISNQFGTGYLQTLGMVDLGEIPGLMMETFNPMDVLFYGIALYEGYRFSFWQMPDGEYETFE